MTKTMTPALLALACLMATPSIAQARYSDGMNLYQYVQSSPIVRGDPFARWGWDLHYKETKDQAEKHLSTECAEKLARADQDVDDKTGSVWFPQYHFSRKKDRWGNVTDYDPGRDDYKWWWWLEGKEWLESTAPTCTKGLEFIGKSLHALQDASAHQAGGAPATGGPANGWGKGHMAETPFDHAPSLICLVWGDAFGVLLPMCREARRTNPNWKDRGRPDNKDWFKTDWDKAAADTGAQIRELLELPCIKCRCKK